MEPKYNAGDTYTGSLSVSSEWVESRRIGVVLRDNKRFIYGMPLKDKTNTSLREVIQEGWIFIEGNLDLDKHFYWVSESSISSLQIETDNITTVLKNIKKEIYGK